MKKPIILLGLSAILLSCDGERTFKNEKMPTKIVERYAQQDFDTLLCIREKAYTSKGEPKGTDVHLFRNNKKRTFIGTVNNIDETKNDVFVMFIAGCIFGGLIGFGLGRIEIL